MQIESLIKPRSNPTRRVDVFGTRYEFKQIPGVPGRYIATVDDENAIAALIKTGAYREFTDVVPKSTLSAPTAEQLAEAAKAVEAQRTAALEAEQEAERQRLADAEVAAAEEERVAAEKAKAAERSNDPPAAQEELKQDAAAATQKPDGDAWTEKAKDLLTGMPQSIKKALANGPSEELPREVIAAALAIENTSDRPRASVIAALQKALG